MTTKRLPIQRVVLVATLLFAASLPACAAAKWAFTGTDTQPSPAEQAGAAAQAVLPPPFGALIAGALGLGALAYGAYAKTKKDSSTTPQA